MVQGALPGSREGQMNNNARRRAGTLAMTLVLIVMSGTFFVQSATDVFGRQPKSANLRNLVAQSKRTLDAFANARQMGAFRALLKDAKGVFIAPNFWKGAFVVGASGGYGVFMARNSRTGQWNGPAFYSVMEASVGLQAGGESSQVILLAMTDRGVAALLGNSVKLGADIKVAAGPVGIGTETATANLSADLISFSRSRGLFAGISVEGAAVITRDNFNNTYYRRPATPTDILIHGSVHNPQADGLRSALGRYSASIHHSGEGTRL